MDPTGPATPPPKVSHMSVAELVNLSQQLRGKSEAEWQRVINLHAALIGVMIFFAGQPETYATARLLVFGFYTFNLVSSYLSHRETFDGLSRVNQDLLAFGTPVAGGASFAWITSRNYRPQIWGRTSLLVLVWLLVGYLMIAPLVLGRGHIWT